jgi:phage tail sheath protein FI
VGEFTEEGTIADADLEEGLSIIEAYDEPTIIVFPEGPAMGEEKYYPLIEKAIKQCAKLQDRFSLVDIIVLDEKNTTTKNINNFRNIDHTTGFKKNDDLNYAAAYYPNLITTYGYQYEDKDVGVSISTGTGTPDEKKLNELKDTDKATYYKAIDAIGKYTITLPPSPAIAGIYAKVDGERGVWKAPANVSLSSVSDLAEVVTDEEQESMNIDAGTGKSINAIRSFSGKGILVWGARTLDGNSNEWRYISVRRFFIMVEESVKKATAPFVFEPNDANTWIRIRAMIENYLTLLWRQGALAGAKPEHAFFVKVGLGQTMSAIDILEGRLIVEIGMAAVRPAEFIILRFSHKMQES